MSNTNLPNYDLLEKILEGLNEAIELGPEFFKRWQNNQPNFPIPPMLTAPNSCGSVPITEEGYRSLRAWAEKIWNNSNELSERITLDEWFSIVSGNILGSMQSGIDASLDIQEDKKLDKDDLKALSRRIRCQLIKVAKGRYLQNRFHLFPVWFAHTGISSRLNLGPVSFIPAQDQIDDLRKEYEKIKTPQQSDLIEDVIDEFKEASYAATCVIKVDTKDLSPNKSQRFARETARIALAATLLPWGGEALACSRIIETPGNPRHERHWSFQKNGMGIPGMSTKWYKLDAGDMVLTAMEESLTKYRKFLKHAVTVYLNNNGTSSTPKNLCVGLRSRWLSAVHWYDRAVSARLDSEAVIHFGVCIDVLSSGQSISKVKSSVARLLGVPLDEPFYKTPATITVGELCKRLYSSGRSKLLHGQRELVKEDFERDRLYGEVLVRHALLAYTHHLGVHEEEWGSDDIDSLMATADTI